MLYTNLKHLETASEHTKVISENENLMIICGSMEPICIHVYVIAEEIKTDYQNVKFYDMEFDNPESHVIRNLSEVQNFKGIPFTIYYKNGKVVKATSGLQTKEQIMSILDEQFKESIKA